MSVLKIRGKNGEFHTVLTIRGDDGYTPVKGVDYSDGVDGKSAYEVAVEQGFVGTEAEWLTSLHGADGKDGKDGQNGADGKDGVDGEKGDPGESGVYIGTDEPTEANVWIDPSGEPTNMVNDVQINDTSIVADGVANIPIASAGAGGVVRVQDVNTSDRGIYISTEGFLSAYNAVKKNIDGRVSQNSISPTNLDYAVKSAMCDGKGAEWTAEEQAMARERIGEPQYELIEEIVLTEDVKRIIRKSEPSGNLYSFKSILIDLEIPANVSHSNTYWRIRSNGVIVAYPNRPIASKAYTSYFQCGAERNNRVLYGWCNNANWQEPSTGAVFFKYFSNGIITDSPITEIEIDSADTFVIGEIIRIYAIRG